MVPVLITLSLSEQVPVLTAWQVVKLPAHRKAAQQGQRDIFHIKTLYFEQKFHATFLMASKAEPSAKISRKGINMECARIEPSTAQPRSRLLLAHGSKALPSSQPAEHFEESKHADVQEGADGRQPGRAPLEWAAAPIAVRMEDATYRLRGRPATVAVSQQFDPHQHPVQLLAELESLRRRERALQATIAQHEEVVRCVVPGRCWKLPSNPRAFTW